MNREKELNPFATRKAKVHFPTNIIIGNEQTIQAFIASFIPEFLNDRNTLKTEYRKSSPYGEHYLFIQQFNNIPVYNSWVKVNTDKNGKLLSIYNNSYETNDWNLSEINDKVLKLNNSEADKWFESSFAEGKKIILKEINLAVIDNIANAVWKYSISSNASYMEYLINDQNEIILSIDLNAYSTDTTAQAYVFLPDPLTRGKKYYNPPFVDNANGFNPSLDSQHVLKDIDAFFLSGNFFLQNDFVEINDFDVPFTAPAVSNTPQFHFDRSQSGFEDVNALYHISECQKYIQSLGFNLSNYTIQVDPHALNGDDNSLFSPATNPPRLYFGTGGVEDAEDADVIVHEYNHALSNDANNSNFGSERRALDEGLCDYFATSYSKSIDTFRWADMFTWDGHNEYWNGRTATSTRIYPNDLSTSIHENGEMWSTALMEIWDAIGREATDKIMLQTLYALSPNMTFADAAKEFIIADTLIFDGSHYCEIYYAFLRRGFIDSLEFDLCSGLDKTLTVDAGSDVTICPGDSVLIGNNITNDGLTYQWQPNENINAVYSPNVIAAPLETTEYIVRVSTTSGTYNTDTIIVIVEDCDISVFNTIGFRDGASDVRLYIPPSYQNAVIRLFDVSGKMLLEKESSNITSYYLNSKPFSPGVYFLSVFTSKKPKVFKLLKQ